LLLLTIPAAPRPPAPKEKRSQHCPSVLGTSGAGRIKMRIPGRNIPMRHGPFAAPVAVGGSVVPLSKLPSAKGLEITHELIKSRSNAIVFKN